VNRAIALFVILAAQATADLAAAADSADVIKKVGFEQRLDQQAPLEATFRDELGRAVRLGDYFDGRPVVLVLAYYRCPMLCTEVLNGLTASLRGITPDMERDYRILTVSFDPRETPDLAAAKKKSYEASYRRSGAEAGWHFLTGEQESIDRLAEAVGFHYVYDSATDQFAHPSGIVVLTPQGKIARYLFGIEYPPRDLQLALVQASQGRIGSPADQLLLLCYHYDAETGRYTASIMSLVRLFGAVTLVAIAVLVLRSRLRERRVLMTHRHSVS
jgi:protein SCO1